MSGTKEGKRTNDSGGLVQDVVMSLSTCFPEERRILSALYQREGDINPEIKALILGKKPLPENTEIMDRLTGEWSQLSDTAREAANRTGLYNCDPCHWHYSWRDIWSRLRLTS